jgi:hypothetical protein
MAESESSNRTKLRKDGTTYMRKASTFTALIGILGLVLALNLTANSAAAVTCPSGMAQLSAAGAIAGASQGGTATVNFTIAAGCNVELSLVSYQAPAATFDAGTASQQVLFDSATTTFAAGANSLSVSVPNCFFQVDFVMGQPITQLGSGGFYGSQGRLISAVNGGSTSCTAATGGTTDTGGTGNTGTEIPVTVTVTPTVTTTTTTTTTTTAVTPAGPITWAPGFGPNGVVASVQTAPMTQTTTSTGAVLGTQSAPIAVANLPSTSTDGGDHNGIVLLGIASLAMGIVLLRAGRAAPIETRD